MDHADAGVVRIVTEGTLEARKRADIILPDANPLSDVANTRRIHMVVTGGRVLDRAALDGLLDSIRTFARR